MSTATPHHSDKAWLLYVALGIPLDSLSHHFGPHTPITLVNVLTPPPQSLADFWTAKGDPKYTLIEAALDLNRKMLRAIEVANTILGHPDERWGIFPADMTVPTSGSKFCFLAACYEQEVLATLTDLGIEPHEVEVKPHRGDYAG